MADGGKPSFEGKTGGRFTSLLSRAAKGMLDVGVDVVSTAVNKPPSGYIGGSTNPCQPFDRALVHWPRAETEYEQRKTTTIQQPDPIY